MLTAVDLFAGAGGFSTGATMAGARVLWAANHWPTAVQWHTANHPGTTHACQDLQQADFRDAPAHDLLLTDPPYGIDAAKGKAHSSIRDNDAWERQEWDKATPAAWLFGLMRERGDTVMIWGGNYFADLLPASKGWLYWNKLMGGDFSDGELAWTNLDRALRHFQYCNKEHGKEHPTQKPVPLMAWCIDKVAHAQTVCDPFMGSGSTGVACAMLGRAFTGVERERRYFDIACERISRAQAQGSLIPLDQTPVAVQQAMEL